MMSLENMIAPDSIGVEKGRYLWNGSRHRVMNHLLALLCVCVCIGIVASNGLNFFSEYDQPLVKLILGIAIFGSLFFAVRAIKDHRLFNVKNLAIVGDKGFSILKYKEEKNFVLSEYVQPYTTLDRIEKHERNDVTEDGVYLQTVSKYSFFAPNKKFFQKLRYNRNDVQLSERDGLPEVKAMFAIEEAYSQSRKTASIMETEEPEAIIPSHPQSVLRIRKPVMWADIEE